jgi:2-phospho-L-lactate/phosphoenolpyruvate guanylyltransferase
VDGPQPIDLSRIWALVPIRGLRTAKTRLSGDLDPESRSALVSAMLRRTLVATRDAQSIAGTVVVTMDPAAAGIAKEHRAVGLVDLLPGLNSAILAARSLAVARGATAVLILPADLPSVSADRLAALVESANGLCATGLGAGGLGAAGLAAPGLVALVPDRHGAGTNAILVSPPDLIDPAFGPDSRAAHRAAAVAAGALYLELDGALTLDVDTAADLLLAAAVLSADG